MKKRNLFAILKSLFLGFVFLSFSACNQETVENEITGCYLKISVSKNEDSVRKIAPSALTWDEINKITLSCDGEEVETWTSTTEKTVYSAMTEDSKIIVEKGTHNFLIELKTSGNIVIAHGKIENKEITEGENSLTFVTEKSDSNGFLDITVNWEENSSVKALKVVMTPVSGESAEDTFNGTIDGEDISNNSYKIEISASCGTYLFKAYLLSGTYENAEILGAAAELVEIEGGRTASGSINVNINGKVVPEGAYLVSMDELNDFLVEGNWNETDRLTVYISDKTPDCSKFNDPLVCSKCDVDLCLDYCIGLTTIENILADGSTKLRSIKLPKSLQSIGNSVFRNLPNLEKVILPDNLSSIDEQAFIYCSSLTDINIPSTCTEIGALAFEDCTSLKTISLPGILTLGQGVFEGCEALETVSLNDDLDEIPSELFYGCKALKNITIPADVNYINPLAFYNCTALAEVDFSKCRLEYIGSQSFYGCSKLASVTFPASIKELFTSSFENCTLLETVDFSKTTALISIYDNVFFGCSSLTEIKLPETITTFTGSCFGNCKNLKTLYIKGDYVLEDNATVSISTIFDDTPLETVYILDSSESIQNNMFKDCSTLKKVILPESVICIGFSAFENCTSLSEISDPIDTNNYKWVRIEENKEVDVKTDLVTDIVSNSSCAFEKRSIEDN